jgi:hypothetical protein
MLSKHKTNPDYIRFIIVGIAVVVPQIVEKSEISPTPWAKRGEIARPNEKGLSPSTLKSVIKVVISIPIYRFQFTISENIG